MPGSPGSRTGGEGSVRRAKVVTPWGVGMGMDVDTGRTPSLRLHVVDSPAAMQGVCTLKGACIPHFPLEPRHSVLALMNRFPISLSLVESSGQ